MKEKFTTIYDKAFKRFTFGTLSIICVFQILGAFLYYLSYPLNYLFLAGCILNVIPMFFIHNVPVRYIKKSIKVYLVVIISPLYIITVICLLKGVVSPLFWHIVVPIYLYTVFPSRKTIKWFISSLCLMLSTFILTFLLHHWMYDDIQIDFQPMSLFQMLLTEIVNAFFAFMTICYCFYYIHHFSKIEITQIEFRNNQTIEKKNNFLVSSNAENDKYDIIYTQIIEYLETKEPYLNPDFKITQMVHDLNTNATYLSKSIKKNTNMNFNNLINYYRIEKVKELMHIDTAKYTLKYI